MQHYLVYTLYLFFIILMIINLIYMLRGIIPLGSFINNILDNSILKCIKVDISPYIILIVLSYLQAVCKYFLV